MAGIKVALLCGGPSLEKGISLNSSRSVLDHLANANIEIIPIYFDAKKNAYEISRAQLYSNNPSDFDFKLQQTAKPLTKAALVKRLKKVDIVFPVMHGRFGEDGEIQSFLEKNHLPFVGSGSQACKVASDKFIANQFIRVNGFATLPSALLKIYGKDHRKIIEQFFKQHKIKRAIVKPANGGSSIGVFSVNSAAEALEKAKLLFSKRMDTRLVLEEFAQGIEFTVIILENRFGLPVALPPTEIETDYTQNQIFDFRKKYLPTRQVTYHCPPRFSNEVVEKIQAQAEQIFASLKMRDFGRFDGWVLPNGDIWFCDFNPISGMEQNSFLFLQSSRIGMTHTDVLQHVLANACRRYGIKLPQSTEQQTKQRKVIKVLFGGATSERQVSLMSGTNVWLKLRGSQKYQPQPFLLDAENNVWRLPYHLALSHTVEEITENCQNNQHAKQRLASFEERARLKLGLAANKNHAEFFDPEVMTLNEFILGADFVFNALHGGAGEDGTLQAMFAAHGVKFNGPDEIVSRLCMDKWTTSLHIKKLEIEGVTSIAGEVVKTSDLVEMNHHETQKFWLDLRKKLGATTLIIKPRMDGCSTGIVHLYTANDLAKYLQLIIAKATFAPQNTFKNQVDIIEMAPKVPGDFLFEKFIETDIFRVKNNQLKHTRCSGWIEMTIGVIEINGKIKALNPSITIAEGEVLTVEEKFQGGTGVNITPPPVEVIPPKMLAKIKRNIEQVATKVGIRGYSRIDIFVQIATGDVLVIEINTLPGLTPSTVLYHQGLAEHPPIFPRELLEMLIKNKE